MTQQQPPTPKPWTAPGSNNKNAGGAGNAGGGGHGGATPPGGPGNATPPVRNFQPNTTKAINKTGALPNSKSAHTGFVPHINDHGHQHHKIATCNLSRYDREKDTCLWKEGLSWGDKAVGKKEKFPHKPAMDGLTGPSANVHSAIGVAVPNGPVIGGDENGQIKGKGIHHSIANQRVSVDNPFIRTRTQLMAARRASFVPDLSYDLDGDGVVGSRDYFVGRNFDKDGDDKLSMSERREAVKALKNGWLDRLDWGHDQSGARRPYPIVQRRGRILTIDNGDIIQETYPEHWNADVSNGDIIQETYPEHWNDDVSMT